MRHGCIFGIPSRVVTRLARFLDTTRVERRPWGTARLSILSPRCFRLRLLGLSIFECLHPTFNRRIKPDAQDMIVARELLAIYDRTLDA
jgi:hypothetical protein